MNRITLKSVHFKRIKDRGQVKVSVLNQIQNDDFFPLPPSLLASLLEFTLWKIESRESRRGSERVHCLMAIVGDVLSMLETESVIPSCFSLWMIGSCSPFDSLSSAFNLALYHTSAIWLRIKHSGRVFFFFFEVSFHWTFKCVDFDIVRSIDWHNSNHTTE